MTLKCLAFAALSVAALALPASAADYIGAAPMSQPYAVSTVCSDTAVLGAIDHNFDYRNAHYLHANLDIADLQGVHETYERPADSTHLIGRTYCEGTAVMNDNRARPVWYVVETTMGFAGIGENVEYCVSGLDPWHVYGANCTSLRP